MNITLDAKLSSSPVADTDRTTTYKTTADSLQVGNSGYSLDIIKLWMTRRIRVTD